MMKNKKMPGKKTGKHKVTFFIIRAVTPKRTGEKSK